MCSHYEAMKERERFYREFGVEPHLEPRTLDMWPGYLGSFICRHPDKAVGAEAVPERETLSGLFRLVPHWAEDTKISRHTFNARSETVAEKPPVFVVHGSAPSIASSQPTLFTNRTGAVARLSPRVSQGLTASPWALLGCERGGSNRRAK